MENKELRQAIRVALRDVIEQAAFLMAREDLVTAPDNLQQIQKSLDEAVYACELLYPNDVEVSLCDEHAFMDERA